MNTLSVLFLAGAVYAGQAVAESSWTARIQPFHIIDNIYYVGTADLASFLITTPAGHILVDSGYEPSAGAIIEGIRALNLDPRDIKVLLTTQAHLDHMGGHARLKELSGAEVLASEADRPVIEAGGIGDHHLGEKNAFPAVKVDRVVHEGEVVSLGGRSMTARITPGHTKGTTTWTMAARDRNGRLRHAVILGSTAVLEGVELVDNREYPQVAADFGRTFRVMEQLPCEVFLAAHLSAFRGAAKAEAACNGRGEDAFIDPEGCRASVDRSKKAFEAELERQQRTRRGGK